MNNQVIGVGDIVVGGCRKIRGQERRYITGLIVAENGNCWMVVDLQNNKRGYTQTIPKKNCVLADAE